MGVLVRNLSTVVYRVNVSESAGCPGCPRQMAVNPSMPALKPQCNGPLYSNTVIGTLAVDGWAVTFGTVRRGLGGLRPRPVPSSLYQM